MADKRLSKKTAGSSYGAESITVLEGLEPVRKRPGMYIGSTASSGLHHLIWEVVDNGIDEAMAGHATEISVTLLDNGMVEVTDNGRGIPVGIHKVTKVSALETVLTKLHAGGKFGDHGGYKVSGGLHGVGVSVVNALSEYLKAEVHREGKIWVQEYKRGIPLKKVKPAGNSKKTGTIIIFKPDATIFETLEFNWGAILDRLRQQAYLTKGITINASDRRKNHSQKNYKFYFEGGIKAYVKSLNRSAQIKNETIFYVDKEVNDSRVEVALQYNDGFNETLLAFANNIINPEGGTHVAGFRAALTRGLNSYARTQNFIKEKDENLTGEDVREGLTAIVSVKLTNPQFEGQTKGKLGNSEIKTYVEQIFSDGFTAFLQENPRQAEAIVAKCLLSAQARIAARTARASILRKGALEGMTLPGKLADCSSRKPEESELYIVEGDSAGGCFFGETKVALTDGRNLSFLELIEEEKRGIENYCYTIKNDGSIGIEKIKNVRKTKSKAAVIKVVLDNEEELICTPNHKFMLRDGSYKEAKNLVQSDSLMPLYRKISQLGNRINKALKTLRQIYENSGRINFQAYENVRHNTNDKNLLKANTILERFFHGDSRKLIEAVENYNHKIKRIIRVKEKIDVYDLEVPETHNFALAGGVFVHNSAKQGRDRKFQAILPLRGKILNVERARLDKMLANNEIKNLVIALGANIDEQFDLGKLRYHRIIIMTDADVDGAHIRTLLLTLFYRHFNALVTNGNLYIAQPPLYQLKKGATVKYAYSDEEKNKIIKELGETNIQRYKGLGEMNPEQLWETTMNPDTRIMKQVNVDDAALANETFEMLMGGDVAPRKHFIQTHAKKVENLDI